jgi:hypothetical protein
MGLFFFGRVQVSPFNICSLFGLYTVTWSGNILQLRAEEQRLLQELATLQEAELATKKAIAEQRAEHERLDGEEERYLREYAHHRRDQMLTDDELIRSAEINKNMCIYLLHFWNSPCPFLELPMKCTRLDYNACTFYEFNLIFIEILLTSFVIYKVVQIWPGQTVTCLHTNSPGHIWTTLYMHSIIIWFILPEFWSWDSVISIMTRLLAGQSSNCGLSTGRSKRFFFSPKHSCWLWGPSSLLLNGNLGLISEG